VATSRLFEGNKLTYGSITDPLLPKLIKAINNATIIEISVSFIQPSGIDLLLEPLLDALKRKAKVSILASDYLTITHPIALSKLMLLQAKGAVTKIYQCNSNESFHMKSYIFVANNQEEIITNGCAFIGSNNISRTALKSSHEWCLRYDFAPDCVSHIDQEFDYIRDQFNNIFQHQQAHNLTHPWVDNYAKKTPKTTTAVEIIFSG